MGGEWREATIEEVAEKVAMGPFGSSIKVETFVSDGIPVISGQHLHGFKVDDRIGFNYVTEEHAGRLRNANVQRGDVIFTHAGNIGQVAFVPWNSLYERYVISQRQFYMRCDRSKVIPEFVVAYFKTPEGQHRLLANTSQTGVPSIARPVSYLRTIPIPLPPIEEQRAIAHILGTLDDKIELNRKMSETLEEMARALFKSWFVNFDPVVWNAVQAGNPIPERFAATAARYHNGAPCPVSGNIVNLFPDSFESSELGDIPKGWEVKPLPQVIDVNPPRKLTKGRVAPYLDMANMPTQGHSPDVVIERSFTSGMRFINGDTLLARITPCLENGKTAFVDFLNDGQVGWGSTEYIVLRPKPPLPNEFAYCLARDAEFREFAIQSMTGSSGRQRVPAKALDHFTIVTPPEEISRAFGKQVTPIFARSSAAALESRTLAVLRDTLLPKLISGKLRVKDGGKLIERIQT
ncbi:type I restriction enzyme S subunit [Geothermobacter ehrlichii]|uniref:Type I restriction enzyme S subunit n=1 Tax=Geothermobacter ehrlichii TaxID=213224 RepID=A0A5D3WKH3_9BACT|nr:restriction endonuclease subunit S [Geothermobacter ehrlichii]TYO98701.1 type I restriction enzyme S subunit [Geothermobacter ehrlichii]